MRTNTNLAASPLHAVPPPAIRWLWQNRIPTGRFTLLLGPPDSGKSFLALDLAARLVTGDPLPGDSPSPDSPPQRLNASSPSVLLLADPNAAEAAASRAPSLPPAAASRIHILTSPEPTRPSAHNDAFLDHMNDPVLKREFTALYSQPPKRSFSLCGNLEDLETAITHHASPDSPSSNPKSQIQNPKSPALLIIDSLPSFFRSKTKPRRWYPSSLARLEALAAKHDIAILAIATIPPTTNPHAAARSFLAPLTSIRSALLLTTDPADPPRRILSSIRSTLCQRPPALAFRITSASHPSPPHPPVPQSPSPPVPSLPGALLDWEPTPADSQDRPFESFPRLAASLPPDASDTELWLHDLLSRGPARASDIARLAQRDGLALRTINRAKQRLAIVTQRDGFASAGYWRWSLPSTPATESPAHTLPKAAIDCHAETLKTPEKVA